MATAWEDAYYLANKYLNAVAKKDNLKYYEIAEDNYNGINGLMLIAYNDKEHENEDFHISINLEDNEEMKEIEKMVSTTMKEEKRRSVSINLTSNEALVLENSLIDMINIYTRDTRYSSDLANPYKEVLADLRKTDNKMLNISDPFIELVEYALKHTDNGIANPNISNNLIERFNGKAVREDFSYRITSKNSTQYVCTVYHNDEPFHNFGGAVHGGRIDTKSVSENAEATINMKIAEINRNLNGLENDGLLNIYENNKDKAREREYNLFATAYLTFDSDDIQDLHNVTNSLGFEAYTNDEIKNETISFLRETDDHYKNVHSAFYDDINTHCPCLMEYAQQAVLSEVSQDKVYVVHEQVGNFSIPRKVFDSYDDVQDYLTTQFCFSELNTGKEEDEQLFYSNYNIQETTVGKLNEVFAEGNGNGYIIVNEAVNYQLNETEGRPPYKTMVQCLKLDPTSDRFERLSEAATQANEDGIKIIPRHELPHDYAKYSTKPKFVLDTAENRASVDNINQHTNVQRLRERSERDMECEKTAPSEKQNKRNKHKDDYER